MTIEMAVEILALLVAIWATWLTIPRPPALDWERLFKTALATVIRGEVEAENGDAKAWEERLRSEVPYHPAGRDLERWLSAPDMDTIQTPALDGERALVAALSILPDPVARYQHATGGDPKGLDLLMSDPAWLGPDYDPASILGPGATWDGIAAWSPEVVEGLMRRLSHLVFVGVGSRDWAALCPVPGIRIQTVENATTEQLKQQVESALERASDRLIFGVTDGHSDVVLQLMTEDMLIRDRVLGVVSIGVDVCTPWAKAAWTHHGMEPELHRRIPFISMVDVDGAQPLARDWAMQRFWEPDVPEGSRKSIQAIDLGPVPLAALSDRVLGRALWTTLTFRLAQGT